MNLVLRELTAASGFTLTKTGGTANSAKIAADQKLGQQQQAQATAYNAQLHPRGADGKFIATGGTVQIRNAQGQAVAEGQVTGVIPGANGPMIQVKNPTTGQVTTVPPNLIQAAPVAEATLGAPGTQGIPTGPGAAARAGKADALKGIPPRSGKDALGQQASAATMAAYIAAYKAGQVTLATRNAAKAKAAANKAKAAAKKAAGPKPTFTKSTRLYYK